MCALRRLRQPLHLRSLISLRCPHEETLHSWLSKLIRLHKGSGWSESLLCTHDWRYVFWRHGLFMPIWSVWSVFAIHLKKPKVISYPQNTKKKADQSSLVFTGSKCNELQFLMLWLKCLKNKKREEPMQTIEFHWLLDLRGMDKRIYLVDFLPILQGSDFPTTNHLLEINFSKRKEFTSLGNIFFLFEKTISGRRHK